MEFERANDGETARLNLQTFDLPMKTWRELENRRYEFPETVIGAGEFEEHLGRCLAGSLKAEDTITAPLHDHDMFAAGTSIMTGSPTVGATVVLSPLTSWRERLLYVRQ